MHSATCGWRERRPDRHGHYGRGILQRECERHLDDARNGAWSFADLAGRHAGAVWSAARSILEEERNAVGRLLLERTGRQRQRRISAARRRRAYYCQTSGRPVGHRAHLTPQFGFENVSAPRHNLLGEEGGGLALTAASFTGTAALVGILGVALMRAAFDFALHFARSERRGGVHPIIEHQAVGYALADAKMTIEATRYLSWRACHAVDTQSPAADELAIQAKIYGSETAVRVITDLMRVA